MHSPQYIFWRPFRGTDLAECLNTQTACIGDEIVGRDEALAVWRDLISSPAFHANVIETENALAGQRILACGMGVFLDPGFVDRELAQPAPGLNSRIIAGIASGDSVVLDREAIGTGNAGAGLDFVNMYGTWRDGILDADALSEVQALLGTSFVEAFAGYRFNRVLKEAIGMERIALARATGTYRVVAEYPERESALVAVSPESARAAPYSLAARLYRYQAPVLRLRPGEQALLSAALDGKTDAELSAELGLSLEAVKKRWLSVFGRVEAHKPDILASTELNGRHRGPQKRHRVIAYVRTHLEELRPFDWSAH